MKNQHTDLMGGAVLLIGLGIFGVISGCSSTADRSPTSKVDDALMCGRHQIPEADCPWCDPSLIQSKGMCHGHGVPEALCSRCDPRLIAGFKVEGDWCAGHDLPESQCLICNPEPAEQPVSDDTTPSSAAKPPSIGEWTPRSQLPPSAVCTTALSRVTFASSDVPADVGLEVVRIERRRVAQELSCTARVAFDGNRYAKLASRAPGFVSTVDADLGQRVKAGDVLAIVNSTELGTAKAEYLRARAQLSLWTRNHAREDALATKHIASERELMEAQTRLSECQISLSQTMQHLRSLGLTEVEIREISRSGDTSAQLPLTCPFPGTVVERSAARGETVDGSTPLFTIADVTRMWVFIDVPEADASLVHVGQSVSILIKGLDAEPRTGTINWVSSQVDRRTRTIAARAEVLNPGGHLRDGMFGAAVVLIRPPEERLLVPEEAVQWDGCCNVVFVQMSDVLYEPRKVTLGFAVGSQYVVEDGLKGHEMVVTTGSFLLKTELLKGSIGAGCCEVQPGAE